MIVLHEIWGMLTWSTNWILKESVDLIAKYENINLVLIQETQLHDEKQTQSRSYFSGYDIIGITYHRIYGTIRYARSDIQNVKLLYYCTKKNIHRIDDEMWTM